jgi:hypothetical protein
MSKKQWRTSFFVAAWCAGAIAVAQPLPPAVPVPPQDTVFFLPNAAPLPAFGGQIDILRGEGGVPGPVVKDKPYSARSITASTQTLADGNRITQRNEARIYRDSQGRTRREQTLGGVGAWQAAGDPVTVISINDPVAGKSYVIDPVARTAREIRPFQIAVASARVEFAKAAAGGEASAGLRVASPSSPVAGQAVTVIRREVGGTEGVQIFTQRTAGAMAAIPFEAVGAYEPAEELGEQILEGLLVRGTRLTDTIPIGAMGNERPIEIVTERWHSADIDTLVRHRHFDPRFGETTYELVNVIRGDPSPDLFTVPQGYEITVEAPQFRSGGAVKFVVEGDAPAGE